MLVTILDILARTQWIRRKRIRAAAQMQRQERDVVYQRLLAQSKMSEPQERDAAVLRILELARRDDSRERRRRQDRNRRPPWPR